MTRGNWDESRAKLWLESQGHTDIRRPCDDPPDYVVEGRYAVEVRRLNRMGEDWGKPLESWEKALEKTLQKVLAGFGPPTEGKVVYVDYDYPYRPPPPAQKEFEREAREALESVEPPVNSLLKLKLECGVRLLLSPPVPAKSATTKYMVNDVSVATADSGWVLSELREHIPRCIKEKSRRVRGKDRVHCYSEWWLVLVDHIEYAGQLEESELEDLREAVQFKDFWKRVVIISPENPEQFYDLVAER